MALLQAVWINSATAEDLTPDARSALERGVAAARGQQWLVALQQLDFAFEKSPTAPEVLFNLALANDRMGGHEIRAIGWYRAYLAVAPHAPNRDQVLTRIGELEKAANAAAYGLINKALSANRLLPTPGDRNGGLVAIGNAQARLGDGPGAFATVAGTSPENMGTYYIDNAYNSLADQFAKADDLANADGAIRKIVEAAKRDTAVASVVSALINSQKIDTALAYADNIKGPQRVQTYLDVAQAQAKANDQAGARNSLDNAIRAMRSLSAADRTSWRFKSIIGTAVILHELDIAKKQLALAVTATDALPKDKRTVDGPENLIEAATSLNDLETAKHLYDSINWNSPAAKYGNKPHVMYLMAAAYIKAGRLADAHALETKITDNFWRQQATNESSNVTRDRSTKRDTEVRDLIRAGKLAEAEAILAREPQTEFGVLRTVLADAYVKANNTNAALRILGSAAAAVHETKPGSSTHVRVALADSYRYAGRFSDARRMLDAAATPTALSALQNDPSQASRVNSLVQQYVKLAVAEMRTKNTTAAKSAATAAIKAAAFIKDASSRGSELQPLAEYAPELGFGSEINTVASNMPAGSNRDQIFGDLTKGYSAAGELDKTIATAAMVANSGKRKDALLAAIRGRTTAGDWKAALVLANDPNLAASLNSFVATEMLSAGLVKEAVSLEPKFAASAPDHNRYLTALALDFANSGNFDSAMTTVMRLSDISARFPTFRSIVYAADKLAGRAKAKDIFDEVLKSYNTLATPDRLKLCNASYVMYVDADDHATYNALVAQCQDAALAAAQALKPGQARNIALAKAFEAKNKREYAGRMFVNAASIQSSYDRSSAINGALKALLNNEAVEKYIQLARTFTEFSEHDHLSTMADAAADAGNRTLANDLMHRWYDLVQGSDDSDRDFAAMATKLIAMGQLDTAAAIIPHIKSASSQFGPVNALAKATVRAGKKREAILFIKQAADQARIAGYPFYYPEIARLAAQAGDYATVTTLEAQFPETYQFAGQTGLTAQLLKIGETGKIGVSLAADEVALSKDKATLRWIHAPTVATNDAWAGDEGRLAKLLAQAPQPRFAAAILLSAADGYAKAKKPDKAKEALTRALELLHVNRPDFLAWMESRIAIAESEVDPESATKRMLAIDDVEWRTRGAIELAGMMISRTEEQQAIKLLRALPQYQATDSGLLLSVIRYLVSHGDAAQAREFIGKTSDSAVRDRMRRVLALMEVRRDETEAAISDAGVVEDAASRAYLYVDLGAALTESGHKPQAFLVNLTADRLAETVTDQMIKSDIFTNLAQNQSRLSEGGDDVSKRKAIAAANTIADPEDRIAAERWAGGLDFKKVAAEKERASKISSDFSFKWRSYMKSTLNSDLYAGIDVYIQSLTSKDPRQIVALLAQAAGDIGIRIKEMQKLSSDWAKEYQTSSH